MKIVAVEPFILHAPVTRNQIADSSHRLTHWGAPGVLIHTDDGITGCGYTGTHAHLPSDRLIADCIAHSYAPLLIGADPLEVRSLWTRLVHHSPIQWVGRAGITHLALSAVDIALWDIKAKAAGMPLWKLLGGSASKTITAYNTDGGWLNWSVDQLIADSTALVEQGYTAVKIKIGSPDSREDCRRVAAVRKAVGDRIDIMVDANGRWLLPDALDFCRRAADLHLKWIEEPLWYDDVDGHRELRNRGGIPIALGEQLYTLDHFQQFITRGAVDYVQADAVRLAGVTEFWMVADLAYAHRLPVAPHIGDMAQVHLQLAIAHPACRLLEYIPWLSACCEHPVKVGNGNFLPPDAPGAGTTFHAEAMTKFRVA